MQGGLLVTVKHKQQRMIIPADLEAVVMEHAPKSGLYMH
jgi:hypothetical protein